MQEKSFVKRVNVTFDGGEKTFKLPANTYIAHTDAFVKTEFNAATTNLLNIGTSDDSGKNNIVLDHDLSAVTGATALALIGSGPFSSVNPTTVCLNYSQSGTVADKGEMDVVFVCVQR